MDILQLPFIPTELQWRLRWKMLQKCYVLAGDFVDIFNFNAHKYDTLQSIIIVKWVNSCSNVSAKLGMLQEWNCTLSSHPLNVFLLVPLTMSALANSLVLKKRQFNFTNIFCQLLCIYLPQTLSQYYNIVLCHLTLRDKYM